MHFKLHPNLLNKDFIVDLPLCTVLLEDECHYPWIFLVPRKAHISRIMDLSHLDQIQLLKELDQAQNILWKLFDLTQLNVAAIGNKTPQLHIHIIGRKLDDPAWPNSVWDHPTKQPYSISQKQEIIHLLRSSFKPGF